MLSTDVCIVGAGPAGTTLSHFLAKQKIDHVLLDKASFPRDKICGDGITVDVLNVLKRIHPDLLEKFAAETAMLPSWGFCFHGSNGKELRFDFKDDNFKYAPFFTTRRLDLDNFLITNLSGSYGRFMPSTKVISLTRDKQSVRIQYEGQEGQGEIQAKIVIGAEGEKPIVTKHLGLPHYREKQHLIGALRVYYKNVKGFNEGNHLEFFFDKELLPGYFWAFPLSENEANVGLGMVSNAISNKKVNLKKALNKIIATHPKISQMFTEAEPLENPQGWGLPLITKAREIAGDRYALIGDAAGMIEPFTGKGIGPGMMSARICSKHIENALTSKNYDLSEYHAHMYRYYKSEIKAGYRLQKSLQYPAVLNAVVSLSNVGAFKHWSHSKMVNEWNRWM